MNAHDDSEDEQSCTCGQCTQDWLSPRMRYRLLHIAVDMMQQALASPLPTDSECAPGLEYLTQRMQDNITKGVYLGFVLVVAAIARVLNKSGEDGIPFSENIAEELSGCKSQTTKVLRGGRGCDGSARLRSAFCHGVVSQWGWYLGRGARG
ncbi:hypothetical protein C8Q74DRAFT_1025932 [Fomes fomentarius]|nr:hypothetical protein C8Q74DRAFT_1025932 [Fomes fomentarius]